MQLIDKQIVRVGKVLKSIKIILLNNIYITYKDHLSILYFITLENMFKQF
jgi:hypothetical protein